MKKPPFAGRLRNQRDVRIFVGDDEAWERAFNWAKDRSKTVAPLVCPENPRAFDWGCVRGRSCTVLHVDEDVPLQALQTLCELLLQAGASRVMAIYHSPKGIRATSFTGDVDFLCVSGGAA